MISKVKRRALSRKVLLVQYVNSVDASKEFVVPKDSRAFIHSFITLLHGLELSVAQPIYSCYCRGKFLGAPGSLWTMANK